ncbi:ArsR/SmtB family transcription factor [Clostridium formicaceticum]|nr:metalloregulator ArsR/SmtB family transcription factor [Clostridium formicaceticum]AOY75968.1 transcriptional regulator [Clostridium formicaceticum]
MSLVEVFKALGDETRARMVNLLLMGELCVCEIEVILEITQSNASRHLNKLKSVGIITYEKKAQWVYYKIQETFLHDHPLLCQFLQQALKEQYPEDLIRLSTHKKAALSCETLNRNKDEYLKRIT